MKLSIKYLLFILLIPILWGCDDNKEDEPHLPAVGEQYYVRYEATVTSVQGGNNVKYTVNTDTGVQTFISGKTFSQTFGPVSKEFNASITADAGNLLNADCNVRIYVCRGSEPFALKANGPGKRASVSYTIDY